MCTSTLFTVYHKNSAYDLWQQSLVTAKKVGQGHRQAKVVITLHQINSLCHPLLIRKRWSFHKS